jgi:hypothetical protein
MSLACSRWWGLPATEEAIRARAADVAQRNAKAMDVSYSAAQREQEGCLVQDHHGDDLKRAHEWARRFVLPVLDPLPTTGEWQ